MRVLLTYVFHLVLSVDINSIEQQWYKDMTVTTLTCQVQQSFSILMERENQYAECWQGVFNSLHWNMEWNSGMEIETVNAHSCS